MTVTLLGVVMRVLITGGLGYIGSHLTIALRRQGHRVDIVDKKPFDTLTKAHQSILERNARGIYCYDATTDEFVETFANINYDVIYHFGEDKVIHEIEDNPNHLAEIKQSMLNVIKLVDGMKSRNRICRVVYASSCAVFGVSSQYKKGKELGEKLLKENTNMFSVLRFGNPLGCTNGLSYTFFKGNGLAERLLALHTDTTPFPLMCDKKGNSTVRSYVFINELINRCITVLDTLQNKVVVVGNYVIPTGSVVGAYLRHHSLENGVVKTKLRKGETFSIEKTNGFTTINWGFIIKYIA